MPSWSSSGFSFASSASLPLAMIFLVVMSYKIEVRYLFSELSTILLRLLMSTAIAVIMS
ncbi:uncharacterized protein EV154DRAFT_503127 [Mucor mucedo]|uniref:uncharacterized protein n=1 Tax=Mucor mucedo TaxID=29922 RepID=UPI00221FD02C|nr:uncharacterized protein EV154DRAFT_503127 [Mucor mucedo]KAI7893063.1 hypothetical protein EV154DRAFT_503127 [Mucor mucedo]